MPTLNNILPLFAGVAGLDIGKSQICLPKDIRAGRIPGFNKLEKAWMRRVVKSPKLKTLLGEFNITRVLGAGSNGFTLKVCTKADNRCFAVKFIQQFHPEACHIKAEFLMHKKFWETKHDGKRVTLSPYIPDLETYNIGGEDVGFYFMDLIDGDKQVTLNEFLTRKLTNKQLHTIRTNFLELLHFLEKNKLRHGDMHDENIIINTDTLELQFLDFGWAMPGKAVPKLELSQPIRCWFVSGTSNYAKNTNYLRNELVKFYQKNLNKKFKGTRTEADSFFKNFYDKVYHPNYLNFIEKECKNFSLD